MSSSSGPGGHVAQAGIRQSVGEEGEKMELPSGSEG